jgi:protein-S-isoprenylcysteine O-methyltransferase Ste14
MTTTAKRSETVSKRIFVFIYGVVCYAIFFGTFLYAIGFVGDFSVPRTLDSDPTGTTLQAVLVNLGLLALFAVQHSVMARPAFKKAWTRIVPKPMERSTYVLFSSLALIVLFRFWQPLGGSIWQVEEPVARAVLYGLFGFGWLTVLITTFLINHFDLFGLRQVWLYLRGRKYTPLAFVTPGPYRFVRHPMYVGWLFAFWATPSMTIAHLLFAVATTAYILIAIQLEERNLASELGNAYVQYRKRVPMLIPALSRSGSRDVSEAYGN